MDLEKFTRKMDSTIRRYRAIYGLLEFLAITFILFLVAVFFNLYEIFKLIPWTEPYVGLSPDIPLLTISYEMIFLFVIVFVLALFVSAVVGRYRSEIYGLLKRTPPKRQNSQDLVEETYPELKDRLKTAYDNRNSDNFIAAELRSSVSRDVDGVASTDLIDKKRIIYSLGVIVVAGFFLAAVFFTGFTAPFSPTDPWDRFPNGSLQQPPITDDNSSSNNSTGIPQPPPPISNSPGVDIDVTLPPGTGHGPGDMLENGSDSNFTPSRPLPPESLSSQHFYDTLPAGYEDIIKEYFRRLAANS
ncbi:MAG: hypothetical protein LBE57_03705 [Methanosarcinales archaeon]|nr:hypothetical protein [Methanosarcinales archaeon]